MTKMDYDKTEPQYVPIVISIIVTILLIIGMTFALIYYFKASLSAQDLINEATFGSSYELEEIRKWEDDFLYKKEVITINEAIYLIKNNYTY